MELSADELGKGRGWFCCYWFLGRLLLGRVVGHVVVVVVAEVSEGFVDVGEV